MARAIWTVGTGLGVATGLALWVGCGGSEPAAPEAAPEPKPAAAKPSAPALPDEPTPTLLVTQAHFDLSGGRPKPLPAKLSLLHLVDGGFVREDILDEDSNVFHKAIPFDDGILTIGAEAAPKPATLKLWRKGEGGWAAETLWSRAWEGARFNRLRDLEVGDVDGDGADELVIATHDRGVVAVGDRQADGSFAFTELSETPDTFVHEIEIGDVDGDGVLSFFATPSDRNKSSGESQPGSVVRYTRQGDAYTREVVAEYADSHAKEILVADVDGDGADELYVVREAHVVKQDGAKQRLDPVRILRYTPGADGWTGTMVATLDDDQCRFLLGADVDGDGAMELVAAGKDSGLWRLERQDDGTFTTERIDADSGGFEHATHAADLDGDGTVELYVAADKQKAFRRYVWAGEDFARTELLPIGPASESHITWGIQDGTF